jgi:hypothetical protein
MRGGERGRGERVYEARGCHATRPLGLGSGRGGAPRFVLLQVDLFFKKEKKRGNYTCRRSGARLQAAR